MPFDKSTTCGIWLQYANGGAEGSAAAPTGNDRSLSGLDPSTHDHRCASGERDTADREPHRSRRGPDRDDLQHHEGRPDLDIGRLQPGRDRVVSQLRPARRDRRRPRAVRRPGQASQRLAGRRHPVPRRGSPGRVQRRRGQRPRDDEPRRRRRADLRLHQPPHLRVGLDGLDGPERERDHAVAAACAAREGRAPEPPGAPARHHRPALRDRDGARRPGARRSRASSSGRAMSSAAPASCTRPARTRSR